MEFLHLNLLLWFLPLAAIPLLLHLFTLHRLKTVELATFRFLFDSYVQQRRRMKFLDVLLALLRMGFLLLLILAISRPVLRHWEGLFGSGGGRDVVLMIDASASMNAVAAGVSGLDRAKSVAGSVLERLAPDDRVTLVRVGGKPEEVATRYTSAGDGLHERLAAIEASPARANMFAALATLYGPGKQLPPNAHLYFFTDGQIGSWDELQQHPSTALIPETVQFTVVDVGAGREVANRAVVGDAPQQHRVIAGLPLRLRAKVANHSKTDTEDVAVSFFVEEHEIARKTLTLRAGETTTAEVMFTPQDPGVLHCRYEIPPDAFTDDDTFIFTLTVEPQVRILLVNGNPATDPFENEALYLLAALSSTRDEEGPLTQRAVAAAQSGGTPENVGSQDAFARSLDVQELPEAQLSDDALRDASIVILANCGGLNSQQFTLLRDFVAGGGGLLIFPGEKVNHDVYSQQLFPVPDTVDQSLISVTMKPPVAEHETAVERFGTVDFGHPALAVFDDPDSRYFRQVSLQRHFPLEVLKDRGNAWPLIEMTNGSPAVIESRFGEGSVLLAAFPATPKWSNLPLKPEFVPLVLRMVSHIRRRPAVEAPSVIAADAIAELSVAAAWSGASGNVTDHSGRTTPVAFQKTTSRLVGGFDRTIEKGYYRLEVTGGQSEFAQHGETAFAVNLSPEESDFTSVTQPQILQFLPGINVQLIDASAEAQQLHGSLGQQREIWRPLILLLFVIMGVEFFLATLGGQRGQTEEPKGVVERLRDVTTGAWIGRMTGAGARNE
jgi:hypothetical protein